MIRHMSSAFVAIIFFGLLANFAWGKSPIRFCASFEDAEHYRLLLLDDSASISKAKSEKLYIPDSVYCENPFWVHSLWPSFEGDKRTKFSRLDYDIGNPSDLDKTCKEKNLGKETPLIKTSVPKLEWKLSNIDASLYKRDSAENFVSQFYNQIFTGYWMADLVCICPHFEMAHQSRTFKAKLVGKCDSSFKKEHRVIPEDYRHITNDTQQYKEEPVKRLQNPDWTPCYEKDYWSGGCKIVNYASKKTLPVHGKIAGTDESLECFKVNDKYYLNFASNIQKISYKNWSESYQGFHCYTDSLHCDNESDSPSITKPFYKCDEFNLKEGGCETVYHGIDFIVDENFHYDGWNHKGMLYFFEQKTTDDIYKFLDETFRIYLSPNEDFREILPEGISEKEIIRIGDDAAQKTTGMFFYKGATKVHYEKFNKPKFKSLKEAMQHCKEQWANNKF